MLSFPYAAARMQSAPQLQQHDVPAITAPVTRADCSLNRLTWPCSSCHWPWQCLQSRTGGSLTLLRLLPLALAMLACIPDNTELQNMICTRPPRADMASGINDRCNKTDQRHSGYGRPCCML